LFEKNDRLKSKKVRGFKPTHFFITYS